MPLSSSFNNFVSSLAPKKSVASSPFANRSAYPTPTGNSPRVTGVLAPKVQPKPTVTPITSNAAATNPVVRKTTTSTLPPAGQQFVNNLSASEKRDANGLLINPPDAKFDRNTGKPIGGSTTAPNPMPTNSAPTRPESPYLKYLNSLFDPDQVKSTQDASTQANLRLAGIQNRNEKQYIDTIAGREKILDASGGLKSGAEQSASVFGRRASAESAYGALEESAAARTAGVYGDNLKTLLGVGKSIYDIEQNDLERNKPVEVGGVLYQPQADGTYRPVAGTQKAPSVSEQYGTGIIGEYNFAKSQGYTGTFEQYQNEDANRKKSIENGSGLSGPQLTAFNSLADKQNKSPLIAAADRTVILKDTIDRIKQNPGDAAQQLNLAYSYIQALDTYQSAVREGELGLVNSIDSKIGQFQGSLQKIQNGQIVRPEVALQMANAASDIVNTIEKAAEMKRKQFAQQAQVQGLGNVWGQYMGGGNLGGSGGITSGGGLWDW